MKIIDKLDTPIFHKFLSSINLYFIVAGYILLGLFSYIIDPYEDTTNSFDASNPIDSVNFIYFMVILGLTLLPLLMYLFVVLTKGIDKTKEIDISKYFKFLYIMMSIFTFIFAFILWIYPIFNYSEDILYATKYLNTNPFVIAILPLIVTLPSLLLINKIEIFSIKENIITFWTKLATLQYKINVFLGISMPPLFMLYLFLAYPEPDRLVETVTSFPFPFSSLMILVGIVPFILFIINNYVRKFIQNKFEGKTGFKYYLLYMLFSLIYVSPYFYLFSKVPNSDHTDFIFAIMYGLPVIPIALLFVSRIKKV